MKAASKPDLALTKSKSVPSQEDIIEEGVSMPPSSPPPSSPPPSSSPPSSSPPSMPAPKPKRHGPPKKAASKPDLVLTKSSAESTEADIPEGIPTVTVDSSSCESDRKTGSSRDERHSECEERPDIAGYDRLEEDREVEEGEVLDQGEVMEEEEEEERVRTTSVHVTHRPKGINLSDEDIDSKAVRHRSNSLDSSIVVLPEPAPIVNARSFADFKETALAICFLNEMSDYVDPAKGDDLKPERRVSEYKKPLMNVKNEDHELEKLKDMEFAELRDVIRNYELHNNALMNVNKTMRKELVKIQERKYHLQATIAAMRKPVVNHCDQRTH